MTADDEAEVLRLTLEQERRLGCGCDPDVTVERAARGLGGEVWHLVKITHAADCPAALEHLVNDYETEER